MDLYVTVDDLYKHKLATILGRAKRLKRILKAYPTESRFKKASIDEIAQVVGIKNTESKIMQQLATLDETYNELIKPRYNMTHSISPNAQTIMGIDTEYLLSPLDSIQFAILQNNKIYSGFIFTNSELAEAVKPREGIDMLRQIISQFKPDVLVGHNFNCDISVIEKAYQKEIPELHNYDDTMKMARKSNVANIIGSAALKRLVKDLFSFKVIEVYKAYREDISLFVEYGLMDALFPIFLRNFFMTGKKPEFIKPEKVDYLIRRGNKIELNYKKIHFPSD